MQTNHEDMSCRAKNQRRLRASRKSKHCSALLCSALLYKPAASGPLGYYPLSHGSRLLLLKGFGDVYLQPQIHNDLQCSWIFFVCFGLFELKAIAIIASETCFALLLFYSEKQDLAILCESLLLKLCLCDFFVPWAPLGSLDSSGILRI